MTTDQTFMIEPGDWESATGECVDKDVMVRVLPGEFSRCEWEYDPEHCKWDSECGDATILIEGTPAQNNYRFCPYCGKAIVPLDRQGLDAMEYWSR